MAEVRRNRLTLTFHLREPDPDFLYKLTLPLRGALILTLTLVGVVPKVQRFFSPGSAPGSSTPLSRSSSTENASKTRLRSARFNSSRKSIPTVAVFRVIAADEPNNDTGLEARFNSVLSGSVGG